MNFMGFVHYCRASARDGKTWSHFVRHYAFKNHKLILLPNLSHDPNEISIKITSENVSHNLVKTFKPLLSWERFSAFVRQHREEKEISRVKTVIAIGWIPGKSKLVEATIVLDGGMFFEKIAGLKNDRFPRDVIILATFLPVWTLGMDFIQLFQPFLSPSRSLGQEITKTHEFENVWKLEVFPSDPNFRES